LGLTEDGYARALRALRDAYGRKPHDVPWLDDKFNRFLEQEAKPRGGGRRGGPVQTDSAGATGWENTDEHP
jgi:hypothetical protein